jgi:hypothetical protein
MSGALLTLPVEPYFPPPRRCNQLRRTDSCILYNTFIRSVNLNIANVTTRTDKLYYYYYHYYMTASVV